MENELRAPRAGIVHEVRVEPGDQVALGQVLMTFTLIVQHWGNPLPACLFVREGRACYNCFREA